jgi:hypothetical protein
LVSYASAYCVNNSPKLADSTDSITSTEQSLNVNETE